MGTYIIFSNFTADSFKDPKEFPELADKVKDAIRQRCPSVRWKDSYVTMNGYDVVDVVEAPDAAEVEKAAMIIRSMAHATTHTTQATPWKSFLQTMAS